MPEPFLPRRPMPSGLHHPVTVDPTGRCGPTRAQARGPRWRRVGHNKYVPALEAPPEQRILDASAHLPATGAVTGWAALRLHEAAYFDGQDGRRVLLVTGDRKGRRTPEGARFSYERLAPSEVAGIAGLRVVVPERALFDELRSGDVRDGVIAGDMALAARVVRLEEMREYAAARSSWRRSGLAAEALAQARLGVRSPQESRLRLVWTLDAGLPAPGVNTMLFDQRGRFIGCADLFDEEAGLVVEYDGAEHLRLSRRTRDAARDEDCRAVGLEWTRVTATDLRNPSHVVRRLRAARARSLFLPPEQRQWTTRWPEGWAPWF